MRELTDLVNKLKNSNTKDVNWFPWLSLLKYTNLNSIPNIKTLTTDEIVKILIPVLNNPQAVFETINIIRSMESNSLTEIIKTNILKIATILFHFKTPLDQILYLAESVNALDAHNTQMIQVMFSSLHTLPNDGGHDKFKHQDLTSNTKQPSQQKDTNHKTDSVDNLISTCMELAESLNNLKPKTVNMKRLKIALASIGKTQNKESAYKLIESLKKKTSTITKQSINNAEPDDAMKQTVEKPNDDADDTQQSEQINDVITSNDANMNAQQPNPAPTAEHTMSPTTDEITTESVIEIATSQLLLIGDQFVDDGGST